MGKYSQEGRALSLSTPLGPDALLLERLSGTEALSRPFELKLGLLAEKPVDFGLVVGRPATVTLTLGNGTLRYFNGIIRRFRQGEWIAGPTGVDTFLRYRAELVPALWLLSRRVQSRIFQQKSVPDILKTVLQTDWHLPVRFQLTWTYPSRNFCVQYRETDFAFVSRLMEDEGICYFFEHTAEGHTLVLTDSATGFPELPAPTSVGYGLKTGPVREPRIRRWSKSQEVGVTRYTVGDWSFQMPEKNLTQSSSATTIKMGTVDHNLSGQVDGMPALETVDDSAACWHFFDGIDKVGGERQTLQNIYDYQTRLAKIRQERQAVRSLRVRGAGDAGHFCSGSRFNLTGHFDGDGSYVLIGVKHRASVAGTYTGNVGAEEYANWFDCMPVGLAYRPRRATPRPRIVGTQTATVVGPRKIDTGTERPELPPFTDKFGRVKVQFHWDRGGKQDADSSCWIRVSQIWAGNRSGAFFWPRIGHEVVVTFEEGDPDRPLITGSVYNAANMPPLPLNQPNNNLVSGVRSATIGSTDNSFSNSLSFFDYPGAQHFQYATHDVVDSMTNMARQVNNFGVSVQEMFGPLVMANMPKKNTAKNYLSPTTYFGVAGGNWATAAENLLGSYGLVIPPLPPELEGVPLSDIPPGVLLTLAASGGASYALYAQTQMSPEERSKGQTIINQTLGDPRVRSLIMMLAMPGKRTFVGGHQINITLLGSNTKHTIFGNDVRYVLVNPLKRGTMQGKWMLLLKALVGFGGVSYFYHQTKDKENTEALAAMVAAFLASGFLPSPAGDVEMIFGPQISQVYWGPKFVIERARNYTHSTTGLFSGGATGIALSLLAVLVNLCLLAADVLEKIYDDYGFFGQDTLEFLELSHMGTPGNASDAEMAAAVNTKSASEKAHGLLILLERLDVQISAGKSELQTAIRQLKAAKEFLTYVLAVSDMAWSVKANIYTALDHANDLAVVLADVVSLALTGGDLSTAAASTTVCDGNYSLTAASFHIAATCSSTLGLAYTEVPGRITLDARGGLLEKSCINVLGDTIQLQTNGSQVRIAKDALKHTLSLVNDTPGVITLKQGKTPLTPTIQMKDEEIEIKIGGPTGSSISMNALGIKLQAGLPEVGSEVSIGAEGISLSYGPPGAGSSIKIGPDGIKLSGGPSTTALLTPSGMTVLAPTVRSTATTSFIVQSPTSLMSSKSFTISSAAITMGPG